MQHIELARFLAFWGTWAAGILPAAVLFACCERFRKGTPEQKCRRAMVKGTLWPLALLLSVVYVIAVLAGMASGLYSRFMLALVTTARDRHADRMERARLDTDRARQEADRAEGRLAKAARELEQFKRKEPAKDTARRFPIDQDLGKVLRADSQASRLLEEQQEKLIASFGCPPYGDWRDEVDDR